MIDQAGDHIGGVGQVVGGREARAWASLNRKFVLRDTFTHQPGHLRFSWDNHKCHRHNPLRSGTLLEDGRVLRRLDRIYGPIPSNNFNLVISSSILPGMALSDHAPVIATIQKGEVRKWPSRHRLNTAHLKYPAFVERMQMMWIDHVNWATMKGWDAGKTLAYCLRGANQVDRCWGKRRAIERRKRVAGLQTRLARAQIALESNPTCRNLQAELLLVA